MKNKGLVNNNLIHYKKQSNLLLSKLVENNITFSILHRILKNECTDIYTNNKSIIICYSYPPYPVWVWCKDVDNDDDIINISNCLKYNYLLVDNYNIILSCELLNKLKEIDDIFNQLSLNMELLSYKLTEIKTINHLCDGYMRLATYSDVDDLSLIFRDLHFEMEGFNFSLEECNSKVIDLLERSELYIWVNKNDKIVATASKSVEGKYVKIGLVYTIPEYRRRGYAINLVYSLTEILLDDDLIPILYTNGSYKASNECYKKIGYKQVGRLCNVGNK